LVGFLDKISLKIGGVIIPLKSPRASGLQEHYSNLFPFSSSPSPQFSSSPSAEGLIPALQFLNY